MLSPNTTTESRSESVLENYIHSVSPDLCGQMFIEHLQTGGKRLRLRLVMELASIFKIPEEKALPWALAVEVLHNASLIHDDIQDGDQYRRGKETIWMRYGVPQAINAGDLGLMLPFLLLKELPISATEKWLLTQALSEYTTRTIQGQALEMSLLDNLSFNYEDYLQAVAGKTGAFFSLPVYGVGILAGLSQEKSKRLGEAFAAIGTIFQLQDDVLDCFGDKGRREIGADLQEGKISALVIRYLENKPEHYLRIIRLLRAERGATPQDSIDALISDFREFGALDDVLEDILEQVLQVSASSALGEHPAVHQLAMQLIERIMTPIRHLWGTDE